MLYRIYIPALDKDGVSMTIDVEADNWMLALRYGLDEIGADRDLIKRAICDIKTDKSIHVMEPAEGHVFILREVPAHDKPTVTGTPAVTDEMLQDTVARAPTPVMDYEPPSTFGEDPLAPVNPTPVMGSDMPTWATQETIDGDIGNLPTGEQRVETARTMERVDAVEHAADDDLPVADEVETSAADLDPLEDFPLNEAELEKYFEPGAAVRAISHLDLQAVETETPQELGRYNTDEVQQLPEIDLAESVSKARPPPDREELMATVFEEMAEIDFVGETVEEALTYALELAVKRIPSEAGWLLLADMNRRDLYFATATGPRAEAVIEYRLPMGKGLAGFCAVNGVSLSLSDVDNDPRFQSTISKQIGYKIRSVACSPVQHDGRVYGAMQIMNRDDRTDYTPGELDVLNYIARRTAEYLSQHVEL